MQISLFVGQRVKYKRFKGWEGRESNWVSEINELFFVLRKIVDLSFLPKAIMQRLIFFGRIAFGVAAHLLGEWRITDLQIQHYFFTLKCGDATTVLCLTLFYPSCSLSMHWKILFNRSNLRVVIIRFFLLLFSFFAANTTMSTSSIHFTTYLYICIPYLL